MATHVTNYQQSGAQIVLDLVNADNNLTGGDAITLTQVTLAAPQVITGVRNTSVLLTAVSGQGRRGSVTVTYNRIDIEDVVDDPVFNGIGMDSLADLIPAINTRFGIQLETGDYRAQAFPGGELEQGDSNITVNLEILAPCYPFFGTVALTVEADGGIPSNARILENGDVRVLENGDYRVLEA